MKYRTRLFIFFTVLAFLFLLIALRPILSGRSILSDSTGIDLGISPFFILGLAFFIVSLLVLANRQDLEAIVVPTGGGAWNPLTEMYAEDQERSEAALKSGNRLKDTGYFVISGHYPHGNMKAVQKSQDYSIYKFFREHGVIPRDMLVEGQAHDTLENTLYALKKIMEKERKDGRAGPIDVGIATYHGHFRRFIDFYKQALKKGMIGKNDFRIHEISTPETEEQKNSS